MNIDTLIHARWIIPMDHDGEGSAPRTLDDHSLAINEGEIIDILPTDRATGAYQALNEHQLIDHAVIPGLINCHTHAAMNLFRGLADDLPLMAWLNDHIWPAEGQWVGTEFVNDGTRHAVAEMIRGGITCLNDMYFFPDEIAGVVMETGIRAVVGLIVIDFPTVWAKDPDEYFSKGLAVHDTYKHHQLIHIAFAPHAPYTVSEDTLRRVNILAEELDLPIQMHLHETADEVIQSEERYGKRAIEWLHELGLLSPRLIAVHMTQLTEAEIALLDTEGVHVVHCPESNLKLASGFCPVAALTQRGVNVALGTDGAASNNDLDLFGEMRTAAFVAKGTSGDSSTLPAYQVLAMATINGAKALGIDAITGSLAVGKSADITAIAMNTIESQPVYNPISHIVYATARDQVSDVWVAGKQLLKDRQLTTINENLVLAKAREWGEKIRDND